MTLGVSNSVFDISVGFMSEFFEIAVTLLNDPVYC